MNNQIPGRYLVITIGGRLTVRFMFPIYFSIFSLKQIVLGAPPYYAHKTAHGMKPSIIVVIQNFSDTSKYLFYFKRLNTPSLLQ